MGKGQSYLVLPFFQSQDALLAPGTKILKTRKLALVQWLKACNLERVNSCSTIQKFTSVFQEQGHPFD